MNNRNARRGRNQAHSSAWIRPKRRLAIYLRDGFRCLYCEADLSRADPRGITLDHLMSRANGRNHHESNLVTACARCNFSRSDKPLRKFATPEARQRIRRHTRRILSRYLRLAGVILNEAA